MAAKKNSTSIIIFIIILYKIFFCYIILNITRENFLAFVSI